MRGAWVESLVSAVKGPATHPQWWKSGLLGAGHLAWRWHPLACALVAVFLFKASSDVLGLNVFCFWDLPTHASKTQLDWHAKFETAKMNWGVLIFVCTALMFALATSAFLIVHRSRLTCAEKVVVFLAFPLIGVGLANARGFLLNPALQGEMWLIHAASGFDIESVLVGFLAALCSTTLVMTGALAATLREAEATATREAVVKARTTLHQLLALTTTWLVAGVIGIGLLHRMVLICVAEPLSKVIEAYTGSATLLGGALYSVLLASAFLPAELAILRRGMTIEEGNGPVAWSEGEQGSSGQPREPERQGSGLLVPQILMQLLAIFGPLLAGVFQNVATFSVAK